MFIKKSESGFAIVVFVDNINIIGTLEELTKPVEYLKKGVWGERFGKKPNYVLV